MTELLGIYFKIAVVATALWTVIFYAITPYLTGEESSLVGSLLRAFLPRKRVVGLTVFQMTVADTPFALAASVALLIPPIVVINLQAQDGAKVVMQGNADAPPSGNFTAEYTATVL